MSRKHWLMIIILTALALAFVLISGQDRPLETTTRSDLPWLITTHDDGSSTVLDIHLGHTDLDTATQKFGTPEGIALFMHPDKPGALEVYFGNVNFGPLKAKIIVNLAATDAEKIAMQERALSRQTAAGRDVRYTISAEDQQRAVTRIIESITYIPSYSGLDADFFRARLGEPDAWQKETDERVVWFYRHQGVTLVIDADGKEVFQYDQPRNFTIPDDAEKNSQSY